MKFLLFPEKAFRIFRFLFDLEADFLDRLIDFIEMLLYI